MRNGGCNEGSRPVSTLLNSFAFLRERVDDADRCQ